jgi:hypothetical protein
MADDVLYKINNAWTGREGSAYVCPNGLKIIPSASGAAISNNNSREALHVGGSGYINNMTIPTASSILDKRFDDKTYYSA